MAPRCTFQAQLPLMMGATEIDMLWTIFVVLLILWLLGFTLHVGGGLIHIILVIAVIMLIYNLITGRRAI
jgi:hypothetical protein